MLKRVLPTALLAVLAASMSLVLAAPPDGPGLEAFAEARFKEAVRRLDEEYLAKRAAARETLLAELTEAHRQAIEVYDDGTIRDRIAEKIAKVRAEAGFRPPRTPEFRVIAAHYGTVGRWNDITDKLRTLADESGLEVRVTNPRLWGDPAPGWKKALVVTYAFRGEVRTAIGGEGSRLRLPQVDPERAVAAVREGLTKRRSRIEKALAGIASTVAEDSKRALESGDVEVIRRIALDQWQTALRARTILPLVDELEAFLGRHPHHAAGLEFDAGRAFCRKARIEAENWTGRIRTGLHGIREARASVAAAGDWQDLEIDAREGDLLAFAAEGRWSSGGPNGSCGATGLSGDRWAGLSTFREARHACLLVRVGERLVWAEQDRGVTRAPAGGRVEACCNDATWQVNSGWIRIRVLVVPKELLTP